MTYIPGSVKFGFDIKYDDGTVKHDHVFAVGKLDAFTQIREKYKTAREISLIKIGE